MLAGDGEGFGERGLVHAGGVGGGGVVGPSEAGAVPVAVAGDGAVFVGRVDEGLEGAFDGILAGFEQDGGVPLAIVVVSNVTYTSEVDLVFGAVDVIAFSWGFERCISRAEDQGRREEDGHDDEDDHYNKGC